MLQYRMGIAFTRSAGKHHVPQADALHAIRNAIYSSTNVKSDPERPSASRRVFVGAPHGQTERLIEVLVEIVPDGFVIYHVMPLGAYYTKQMRGERP